MLRYPTRVNRNTEHRGSNASAGIFQPDSLGLSLSLPSGTQSVEDLIRGISEGGHLTPSARLSTLISIFETMRDEQRAITPGILCVLGFYAARNVREIARLGDEGRGVESRAERFFVEWAEEGYRVDQLSPLDPRQIVILGRAMAIAGVNDGKMAHHLVTRLRGHIAELPVSEAASVAWAYASLDGRDWRFMRELMEYVSPRMERIGLVDGTNLIWALAKTSWKDKGTLHQLCRCLDHRFAEERADPLSLGEYLLSSLVWSMAKAGVRDVRLLELIGDALAREEAQLTIRSAPHLMWGFASLGMNHEQLTRKLLRIVEAAPEKLSASNVASVVWSLAIFDMRSEKMFARASQLLPDEVAEVKVASLGRLAWGCAKQGYRDERLFHSIGHALRSRGESLLPQTVVNTAWAFATLSIEDEALFKNLRHYVVSGSYPFPNKLFATVVWSFAVNHPHLLNGMASRESLDMLGHDNAAWIQMHNALLVGGMIEHTEHFARYHEIVSGYQLYPPNRFERDVEQTLRDILRGKSYSLTHQPIISGIPTDYLVEVAGKKVAIECDGDRYHQLWGPAGPIDVPPGKDALQDQVFRRSGIDKVIHIRASKFYEGSRDIPELLELFDRPNAA